jgi:serine/threonine protein kinase
MSQLNSPDVVYFFGTCLEPKICIVMEYCSRGSLYHVLQAKNVNIDWSMVFKLAIGALRGINTLHTWKPQIVHRDLKSLNLLVDDAWNVKVCDFGLSRFTDAGNLSTLGKLRGTFAYCAPEVYFGERFSTKSDVYSIGVILWELVVKCITGEYERPYAEYKHLVFDFQIIIQTAKKGLRPSLPKGCPESFANLIKRCWDAEPENRPDCPEITAKLEEMKLEYEMNKEAWDSVRAVKVYTEEDMADEENNSSSILPGGGSHGNSSTSTARLNAGSGSTSTLSLSSSSSALDGSTTDTKSSQPSARDTPHNAAPNTTDKTDIASQPSTAPQQVDKDTKCSNSSSPTTTTVSEDSQISGRVGTNSQVETTTAKAENKKIKKLKKKKGSRRGSRVTDTTTEKKKSKKGSKVAKEGSKVGDPAKKEKKKKKKKKAVVEDA